MLGEEGPGGLAGPERESHSGAGVRVDDARGVAAAVLDGLLMVLGAVVLVAGLVTTHAYVITGGLIAVAGAAVIATGAGRLARYLRR